MSDKSESKLREYWAIEAQMTLDGNNLLGASRTHAERLLQLNNAYESLQSQLEKVKIAYDECRSDNQAHFLKINELQSQLAEAQAENLKLKEFKQQWDEKDGNSPGYNLQKAKTYGEQAAKFRIEHDALKAEIDKTYKSCVGRDFAGLPLSEAVLKVRERDWDKIDTLESQNKILREGLVHAWQLIEEIEPEDRTITENQIMAHLAGMSIELAQADAVKGDG